MPEIPLSLASDRFRDAWAAWIRHRQEIRHRLTPESARRQLALCERIGEERAVAEIELSIRNGWRGLFDHGTGPPANGQRRMTGEERRNDLVARMAARLEGEQ